MDMIAEVRAFNRFYTAVIGMLRSGMHDSPYSLTEARVLFELNRSAGDVEVGEIKRLLGLDGGYLSRVLARLEGDDLVRRERSAADARRQVVTLTAQGRDTFAHLDERSDAEVSALLDALPERDRARLVASMGTIREVLGEKTDKAPYVIRPPRPGDLGWVVARHGAVYAREYGWGADFEALVARICADFLDNQSDPGQSGWIVEVDGHRAGCVFCVRKDATTAQLRLLLVEPSARGLGIGSRLVEECLRFARDTGYQTIMLWTRDPLTSARRIYESAGFKLTAEEPGNGFMEQFWERPL
ncbi:helix-turn-helix domain-containing GNAT family N-acetyltransferase [Acrocarpospora macrocephala]|uniref:MarR family transcriptional regulator n=1 Tax=Acrocarpospora macrocephala TaxID=150177 RepID=A0A5M3WW25_9ACTN|nr:helix-turn-helix domain-containing GNAT family N-acetyltransferase [Acrocarpospora macrocephala]GES10358.1 MarR family transcriptional regulator [Acrocarpospora macrocephala]